MKKVINVLKKTKDVLANYFRLNPSHRYFWAGFAVAVALWIWL